MRYIPKYYWIVAKRAIKEALAFLGYDKAHSLYAGIIAFLITVVIAAYYFGWSTTVETWVIPLLIGVAGTMTFFVAVFLYKLIQVPALIYRELGGFKELRLGIVPQPTAGGWLTFVLQNKSAKIIEQCYAVLDKVDKEDDPSYKIGEPVLLAWSSENPPINGRHDIIGGSNKRVDVASAHQTMDMMGFTIQNSQSLRFVAKTGIFHAQITIHGTYDAIQFRSTFTISFTYRGGAIFECDKNGQEIILTAQYRQ